MSQDLQFGDATPTGLDVAMVSPRLPSATRRVRARLARRITAQRPGPIRQVLEPLATVHRELHPKADLALLQRAYDVAESKHVHQKRKSGDPYITHPLAVATILAQLGMDTTTLVAALLHDTVEDTDYSLSRLTADFGEVVTPLRPRPSAKWSSRWPVTPACW